MSNFWGSVHYPHFAVLRGSFFRLLGFANAALQNRFAGATIPKPFAKFPSAAWTRQQSKERTFEKSSRGNKKYADVFFVPVIARSEATKQSIILKFSISYLNPYQKISPAVKSSYGRFEF